MRRAGVQPRRIPPLNNAAMQVLPAFVSTQHILGSMAGAAMTKTIHQIRPTVPFRRLAGVRLEGAVVEEHHVPTDQAGTYVERKWKLIGLHGIMNRRQRLQI